MRVDKLIYDVREGLKAYSDDVELDDRYILYLYDIKRSKYLRQEINNSMRTVDQSVTQNINVEVEKVENELGLDFGCNIVMRTKNVIPEPLQLHTKTAIMRVASLDKISKPFNFITREKAVYAANSSFPNSVYAFLHNDDKMYLVSSNPALRMLESIDVTGVFEHPLDAIPQGGETLDMEYPIQPHFVDLIKNEIIKELAALSQIPEDKINNSDDQ